MPERRIDPDEAARAFAERLAAERLALDQEAMRLEALHQARDTVDEPAHDSGSGMQRPPDAWDLLLQQEEERRKQASMGLKPDEPATEQLAAQERERQEREEQERKHAVEPEETGQTTARAFAPPPPDQWDLALHHTEDPRHLTGTTLLPLGMPASEQARATEREGETEAEQARQPAESMAARQRVTSYWETNPFERAEGAYLGLSPSEELYLESLAANAKKLADEGTGPQARTDRMVLFDRNEGHLRDTYRETFPAGEPMNVDDYVHFQYFAERTFDAIQRPEEFIRQEQTRSITDRVPVEDDLREMTQAQFVKSERKSSREVTDAVAESWESGLTQPARAMRDEERQRPGIGLEM